MATFTGLNLTQDEISGIFDSTLEMLTNERDKVGKLIAEAKKDQVSDKAILRERVHYLTEREAHLAIVRLEFLEILKSHGVEVNHAG